MVPLHRGKFLVVHLYSNFSMDHLDFFLGKNLYQKLLFLEILAAVRPHFCRAMLCINAAIAVMRCPSVRLSRSWIMSKRVNISSNFSPSGSHTILVFPYQTGWRYSNGNPPNEGVECRWGRQKSRFWSNSWLSKIVGRGTCEMPKSFTDDKAEYMTQSATHH